MIVLSVDLSSAQGSLALALGDRLLEEFRLESSAGYGEIVFAAIEGLLRRHALPVEEIDLFAAGAGPGTFTGVRMGITVVQGLAEALGKAVCAVSNLQALAHTGAGPLRAPALDARRGEYYTAIYDSEDRLIRAERLETLAQFRLDCGLEPLLQTGPLAAAIAAIAIVSEPRDPADLEANYIRRTDADLNLVRPT